MQRGAVLVVPELGHSVHVEVEGLEPSRWYWYRFIVGNEASPPGRTRTAPAAGSTEALKFAFVSCQHYAHGFYYAHKHLADESLDFAVHLRAHAAPRRAVPTGPDMQLYRRLSFGELLSVQVLDTRQYRSHRAPATCMLDERVDGYCPSALDPTRTIAGPAQDAWMIDGLTQSTARWNLLANQVPFARNDTNADPLIKTLGGEKWDGYPAGRQKVLDFIAAHNLVNTVIITATSTRTSCATCRPIPSSWMPSRSRPNSSARRSPAAAIARRSRFTGATRTIRTCASRTPSTATCGAR